MGRSIIRNIARGLGVAALLLGPAAAHAGAELLPRLSLTAEQRFDDELLVGEEDTEGLPFLTKISPRAGFELLDARGNAAGWYATDLSFRLGGRGGTVDHRGQLGFRRQLTELTSADADVRIWRVSDPTSLPRMGMARVLAPILYGSARAGIGTQLDRRWSVRGQYLFEGARIDAPGLEAGDVHSPSAEVWYRLTARQDLGAEYRFQYFTYGDESSNAHGAFAAYRVRLTEFTTLTARGGPVRFASEDGRQGYLPRLSLEVYRDADGFEFGLSAGHDLVGASGFSPSLWADYATLALGWRLGRPFRLFAATSFFRNGQAPNDGWTELGGVGTSQGYALGGGVEWFLSDRLTAQFSADRIAQVGAAEAGVDLERNVAAVRLILTAF